MVTWWWQQSMRLRTWYIWQDIEGILKLAPVTPIIFHTPRHKHIKQAKCHDLPQIFIYTVLILFRTITSCNTSVAIHSAKMYLTFLHFWFFSFSANFSKRMKFYDECDWFLHHVCSRACMCARVYYCTSPFLYDIGGRRQLWKIYPVIREGRNMLRYNQLNVGETW